MDIIALILIYILIIYIIILTMITSRYKLYLNECFPFFFLCCFKDKVKINILNNLNTRK